MAEGFAKTGNAERRGRPKGRPTRTGRVRIPPFWVITVAQTTVAGRERKGYQPQEDADADKKGERERQGGYPQVLLLKRLKTGRGLRGRPQGPKIEQRRGSAYEKEKLGRAKREGKGSSGALSGWGLPYVAEGRLHSCKKKVIVRGCGPGERRGRYHFRPWGEGPPTEKRSWRERITCRIR